MSSTSSKARKSQRPKKSASATGSQESEASQPGQPSQESQESQLSHKQTSRQSSEVVETPPDDAPREESDEDDDEIVVDTNVEPSTSGREIIDKQSYVVTMNDQSELMPTSESQSEQPRTQTVIKKAKSQKKGKAKIDVKAVTGMEQEDSQEEKTQEQGDAFTLELDEDPLVNSGMFVTEDTSETMETEASTTPASTKRKGKPKKLSSAKVCVFACVCCTWIKAETKVKPKNLFQCWELDMCQPYFTYRVVSSDALGCSVRLKRLAFVQDGVCIFIILLGKKLQ